MPNYGVLARQAVLDRAEPSIEPGLPALDALAQWGRGVQWRAQNPLQAIANNFSRDPFGVMMGFAPVGMVKAYHGSPHDLPLGRSMLSDKIGSGEGAQAYGHGLYAAESPAVANTYRTAGTTYKRELAGISPNGQLQEFAIGRVNDKLRYGNKTPQEAIKEAIIEARTPRGANDPAYLAQESGIANYLETLLDKRPALSERNMGNLYELELSHPNPAKEAQSPLSKNDFMHWDLPLSQQPQVVQDALAPLMDSYSKVYAKNAGDIYRRLAQTHGAEELSKKLHASGVQGVRYLDGGSRAAKDGTYNYVFFDPKLANVVGKQ